MKVVSLPSTGTDGTVGTPVLCQPRSSFSVWIQPLLNFYCEVANEGVKVPMQNTCSGKGEHLSKIINFGIFRISFKDLRPEGKVHYTDL